MGTSGSAARCSEHPSSPFPGHCSIPKIAASLARRCHRRKRPHSKLTRSRLSHSNGLGVVISLRKLLEELRISYAAGFVDPWAWDGMEQEGEMPPESRLSHPRLCTSTRRCFAFPLCPSPLPTGTCKTSNRQNRAGKGDAELCVAHF